MAKSLRPTRSPIGKPPPRLVRLHSPSCVPVGRHFDAAHHDARARKLARQAGISIEDACAALREADRITPLESVAVIAERLRGRRSEDASPARRGCGAVARPLAAGRRGSGPRLRLAHGGVCG